jgi:hypothetical protein
LRAPAVIALVVALLSGAAVAASQAGSRAPRARSLPLTTAFVDPATFGGPDVAVGMRRARSAGAGAVRIDVNWSKVAPSEEPSAEKASDPAFAGYQWDKVDRQVRLAVANGLDPILSVALAPRWAERGAGPRDIGRTRPDPASYGRFAKAIALRYSGSFGGLPRVRAYQAWNEPNLAQYIWPQFINKAVVSAGHYRKMLNAFATAVHGVHTDNLVVAGGLAPFTSRDGKRSEWGSAPLNFMRLLLCVSKTGQATCSARSQFDVWAHHPYTSGGPTHHAFRPDDVSLGDLPDMDAVLDAGVRTRHIVSRRPPQFWVTEFAWDTRPPDPGGVPLALHARWTSEALYRMWDAGVSLVAWWGLRDTRGGNNPFQTGLYGGGGSIESDRPKPSLQAFRFPFVALPEGRLVRVWGRTPSSGPGTVVVQQRIGSAWKRRAVLRADRYGIFTTRLRAPIAGTMRARALGGTSLPFGVKPVPDRHFNPFGSR